MARTSQAVLRLPCYRQAALRHLAEKLAVPVRWLDEHVSRALVLACRTPTEAGTRMKTGWMVEALADMETFAELNGLGELQKQLAVCRQLARAAEDDRKAAQED